jgi:hypothetical protein
MTEIGVVCENVCGSREWFTERMTTVGEGEVEDAAERENVG